MKLKSEKEINIIVGKLLVGKCQKKDIQDYLYYVAALEKLVEEASQEDFYGTEGWRRRIGWD